MRLLLRDIQLLCMYSVCHNVIKVHNVRNFSQAKLLNKHIELSFLSLLKKLRKNVVRKGRKM